MQPTASKSHLLVNCSYAFGPEVEDYIEESKQDPSPPMRYGSGFHEAMEQLMNTGEADYTGICQKWGLKWDELIPHVTATFKHLKEWLGGRNPWGIDWSKGAIQTELPLAISPFGAAKPLKIDLQNHVYLDLPPGHVAGTADLVVHVAHTTGHYVLVIDYKTGEGDFSQPDKNEQLLTLAEPYGYNVDDARVDVTVIVGILHSSRSTKLPIIYSEIVDGHSQNAHAGKLQEALIRIGDGSMRPGTWCKYCPALGACPTNNSQLLKQSNELVEKASLVAGQLVLIGKDSTRMTKEQKMGQLHMLIQQFRELDKKATAEIKRVMSEDSNVVPFRPDGKSLTLKTKKVESLSKASIIRALGKEKGEEMITQLREMGCIESSERIELHTE